MAWYDDLVLPTGLLRLCALQACDPGFVRIELSEGVGPAGSCADPARDYESGALVPQGAWRTPTADEWRLLTTDTAPADMGRSIAVVRLCDQDRDLRVNLSRKGVVALLQRNCALEEPLICIGYGTGLPGLRTTTIDQQAGTYTGLHVDNWDRSRLGARERALNRVCVNIGREPRYFLYLPASLTDIAALTADALESGAVAVPDYTGLARVFMTRYPWFPVVRCRLEPNEAYIAPTENLVHDGSSAGQTSPDEHYTILGHIRLGKDCLLGFTNRRASVA
jgi:hypothetical protein